MEVGASTPADLLAPMANGILGTATTSTEMVETATAIEGRGLGIVEG